MNLFYPGPVNSDWVRAMLLEYKTRCEMKTCGEQATHHYVGKKTIAYVCEVHDKLIKANPSVGVRLANDLWERFQEGFNFIRQVESSGGKLLQDLRELEDREREAQRQRARDQNAAVTQARKAIKANLKQGKVGAPDDELATARGVQSPPRDPFQLIFRVPELGLLEPVILPPHDEPDPLIQVRLL